MATRRVLKHNEIAVIETYKPTPVTLTDAALARVRQLLDVSEAGDEKFRIYVAGGGCSGFSYGFKLDEQAEADDTCIENEGVEILIDPLSLQYLNGAFVDYKEDFQGQRFFVNNPNASSTCGCGHSFSL